MLAVYLLFSVACFFTVHEHCDKAYILENGVIKMEGTGEELLNSPEVMAAYLGEQISAEQ